MHEQLTVDQPLDYELYDIAVDPEHIQTINEIGANALKDTVNLDLALNTTNINLNGFNLNTAATPSNFSKEVTADTSKFDQPLPALEDGPNTSSLSEYGMSFDEMQNLKADLFEKSAELYDKPAAEQRAIREQQIQNDIMLDIIDKQRDQAIRRDNKKKSTWAQNTHI
jgi:hypothetical protein